MGSVTSTKAFLQSWSLIRSYELFHMLLLMEEILHHLGWLKPYKQWDNHHPWWCRILSINSTVLYMNCFHAFRVGGLGPESQTARFHLRIVSCNSVSEDRSGIQEVQQLMLCLNGKWRAGVSTQPRSPPPKLLEGHIFLESCQVLQVFFLGCHSVSEWTPWIGEDWREASSGSRGLLHNYPSIKKRALDSDSLASWLVNLPTPNLAPKISVW